MINVNIQVAVGNRQGWGVGRIRGMTGMKQISFQLHQLEGHILTTSCFTTMAQSEPIYAKYFY